MRGSVALALALNSAAYSTQLFHGAVKAISKGQWESCAALGLSRMQTLKILIPYALKRALRLIPMKSSWYLKVQH